MNLNQDWLAVRVGLKAWIVKDPESQVSVFASNGPGYCGFTWKGPCAMIASVQRRGLKD